MTKEENATDHPLQIPGSDDDIKITKLVVDTHSPDGREVNVKALVNVINEILQCPSPDLEGDLAQETDQVAMDSLEDKMQYAGLGSILDDFSAHCIHKISCEISSNSKYANGADVHLTTLAVFNTLSYYSWYAKVVLALAAYVVHYGEFWLVAQLYSPHRLAYSIAFLNHSPDELDDNVSLKPRIDATKNLIKVMLHLTKCIIEFKELPADYITPETPVLSMALNHIPLAVYWTIRSVVACSLQIMGLTSLSNEYLTSTIDAYELERLAQKLGSSYVFLNNTLPLCHQHIYETKQSRASQTLAQLFEINLNDNMKILKALISAHNNLLPLWHGSSETTVELEVLKGKNLLLLISDLDISFEELSILKSIHKEFQELAIWKKIFYEIVWLPVVQMSSSMADQKKFETTRSSMPWYSVRHPSLMDAAMKYIKEIWCFNKKPIIVVLDGRGKVVNKSAQYMLWIWRSKAIPFTSAREDMLWGEEDWSLSLLVDGIDLRLLDWVREGKLVILYGGENIQWIRQFTQEVKVVLQSANAPFEMVYVGKSNPNQRVRKIISIIKAENLSHSLEDLISIWFFWYRIECMWFSKKEHNMTIRNDSVMQEIETIFEFGSSDQGWALVSNANDEMAKAKGETMLMSFKQFDLWNEHVESRGFLHALNDHLCTFETQHYCTRIEIDASSDNIPQSISCVSCGRVMEKIIVFRCHNS